ncbi:MAG: SRPBCC family protein [Pirellulales bacterium]
MITVSFLVRLWLGVSLPVSRQAYLVSGLCLAAVKYACEAAVIWGLTGLWFSPIDFLNPSLAARSDVLDAGPEWLGWALFAWNLPFVWIALSMSVRRAASAGLSPWVGVFVLVPLLGVLVMLGLGLCGDRAQPAWEPDQSLSPLEPVAASPRDLLWAVLAGLAVGGINVVVCVYLIESYAAALFLGTPLVMGAVTGFLFNRPRRRSLRSTIRLGFALVLVAAGVLLVFAIEGAICIVMAAPIVSPLTVGGVILGKAVADATSAKVQTLVPLLLALPLLAGAESLVQHSPEYCVLTTVEVNAPPAEVWPHVVAFPDLPEPEEWFFRCGIACPLRARIEGTGVGAVRHCEFTTGDFVEPVTAWEPPSRLAFDVTSQPDPMVELSPWRHVHPPHLEEQTLKSRRGEFRLVPLENGRTRLEGRTWYTFDMHPQGYWKLWSDLSIHAIHRRVLNHIRQLAEKAG